MAYLFVGGEEQDFQRIGAVTADTAFVNGRRTGYARCAMRLGVPSAGSSNDFIQATFLQPATEFWMTARCYLENSGATTGMPIMIFMGEGVRRFAVTNDQTYSTADTSDFPWVLRKGAVSPTTILATSGNRITTGSLLKIDCHVRYGTDGFFRMYIGGAIVLNYTGDITSGGAGIDAIQFGRPHNYYGKFAYWSEVVVSTTDTRSVGLMTLVPSALGNAFQWTGGVGDINELSLNDATAISTPTANQVAQFAITPPTALTATTPIGALVINARAQKGETGPQNIQGVARTQSQDFTTANVALPTSLAQVQMTFPTNPQTGSSWTGAQLLAAGFNVGLMSRE